MDRDSTIETGSWLTALRRYMRALEHGDLDAIAAIVRLAETDVALERMLLAINEAYMEQQDSAPDGDMGLAADDRPLQRKPADRARHVWPTRRSRAPRPGRLSTFAAVLALVAVLGGFITVLSSRGVSGPSQGVPTLPPVAETDQPTVAQGGATIVAGTQQGRVFALRTDTGAVAWRWNGRTVDTLVRSATTVYIASHPGANDGDTSVLTALQATNGAQLWQVMEPQLAGYTYMALDGDMLLVASGYGDGTIYALDAHTGLTRWSQPGVGGLTQRLITSTRGITYVSSSDGGFNAYAARSGKLLWQFRWKNNEGSGPALTQGNNGPTVVAGSEELAYYYTFDLVSQLSPSTPMVVAFTTATGAVQQRLSQADIGHPLLVTAAGIIYTTKGDQLCAFHLAGGEHLWCTASITGMDFSLRLVPTSSALLYSQIANGHAEVGALDRSTGRQIWSWQGPTALYSAANSMSLAGDKDRLCLATRDGMYTFQASTGKLLWHSLAATDLSFIQPVVAG